MGASCAHHAVCAPVSERYVCCFMIFHFFLRRFFQGPVFTRQSGGASCYAPSIPSPCASGIPSSPSSTPFNSVPESFCCLLLYLHTMLPALEACRKPIDHCLFSCDFRRVVPRLWLEKFKKKWMLKFLSSLLSSLAKNENDSSQLTSTKFCKRHRSPPFDWQLNATFATFATCKEELLGLASTKKAGTTSPSAVVLVHVGPASPH